MNFLKACLRYVGDHLLLFSFIVATFAGEFAAAAGLFVATFYFKLDDIHVQLKKVGTTANINIETVTVSGRKEV